MSYHNGPRIVTNGLVMLLDAANSKSYPGSGNTWSDLSGSGYDGTLTNGPTYSSSNNGVIVFDGVNDYITRALLPNFNIHHISLWIKPATTISSSTSPAQTLIQLRYQESGGNYAWYMGLGGLTALINNEYITIADVLTGGRRGVADGGSLLANTWYNLVFNYESSLYKFYVNNIVKTTISSTPTYPEISLLTNPNKLYIGALDGDGGSLRGFFNGSIGQVAIYNRSLSTSEITQNYQALKSRYNL